MSRKQQSTFFYKCDHTCNDMNTRLLSSTFCWYHLAKAHTAVAEALHGLEVKDCTCSTKHVNICECEGVNCRKTPSGLPYINKNTKEKNSLSPLCLSDCNILLHKELPFGKHTARWNQHWSGRTTSVHGVLTLLLLSKTTLSLRPGKCFNGWGKGKKNLTTIKHKPRLYLGRSSCCIPSPDNLWDAAEVPLKRERMREQLFSVTGYTACHDFPL